MRFKTLFLFGVFFVLQTSVSSQDYFSYGNGNFGGLNQVIANPAAAADNRLKLDVILAGFDITFNNSWFGIKREALKYTGTLSKPSSIRFPNTWKNATPNVPDNVFKNFSVIGSGNNRSILLENRLLLPSFMVQLSPKNTVAFMWNIRQMGNVDGMSQQLTNLFENEMNLNVLQNNVIQNKNLHAVQMTWSEYALTYARVLKDDNSHFIKAGITPKLLQGIQSGYMIIRNLDFYFSTKDTLSYFDADFSYARSAGVSSPFRINLPGSDRSSRSSSVQMGLDLGFIYEWRPNYRNYKYRPDGKNYSWRKDLNKYKIKFGASIVDIGKIKFKKEGTYYDLNVSIKQNDIRRYITVSDPQMFDSLLNVDYPSKTSPDKFQIMLPTAVNTQLDFSFNQFFYLNLSAHLTGFYRSNPYKVHNYTSFCFAPRVECYWFDVSVPFTYNMLSAQRSRPVMYGLNIRLGPLSLGSNDVLPLFNGDLAALNFYAILKVSIPYKHINDQDRDKVKDRKDECPDDAGDPKLNGCPDKDQDGVPDKMDACPAQAGLLVYNGCPDTDGDGIVDASDQCPKEKGSIGMKGCPDSDNDSIADKEDVCPNAAGPKEFKGCPDTDKDGIVDKDDLCPNTKGQAKYKGCPDSDNDGIHDGIDRCKESAGPFENNGCPWPDSDKDGVIDKLDSCVTIAGTAMFKGCPEPVTLAPAEKKILSKAFASLEFESGKDIIKPVSFGSLNALAKLLAAHKEEWKLKLSGHTDNEGSEESNLLLSEKRTKAVRAYLLKKGVLSENIVVEWFGQTRPIADNATKAGKQKNRRVEMAIESLK